MEREFVALFAPYRDEKQPITIEQTLVGPSDVVVAMALWKNAIPASLERIWIDRMGVAIHIRAR
jgi:hypothetical protein